MKVMEVLNNETVRIYDGRGKLLMIDEKWVVDRILKDAESYDKKCIPTFINHATVKAIKHENDELYISLNEIYK